MLYKIIIADDSETNREMYKAIISSVDAQAEVDEAATGSELVAKALQGNYSLVFTDNQMAGGDDGLQAIVQIREHDKAIPIYMVSGDADAEKLTQRAMAAGATGFIKKCQQDFFSEMQGVLKQYLKQ